MSQTSEQIAIKRNIWNQLGLNIQLDIFQYLRAYDLYKNGRFASRQWHNVIERHKEMLPKIRKIPYWRAQNRLSGDSNEEIRRQRVEQDMRKICENLIKNYALLCIISCFAAIYAQTISIERTSAMFLLLAVSLQMTNAYTKFYDDLYRLTYNIFGNSIYGGRCYIKICYKRYSTDNLDFLRYVWTGYLGTRTVIFVIIGILRRIMCLKNDVPHIVQADNVYAGLLWILHIPEAGFLMNWSFNALCIDCFFMSFRYRYQRNIKWLKPGTYHQDNYFTPPSRLTFSPVIAESRKCGRPMYVLESSTLRKINKELTLTTHRGEQLVPQNSEHIAVKRNIWNQLGLDTQLDVFQYLRAFDLYRNGRFVSCQWYNVIERQKEMLPKFRKLRDCSEQNKPSGDSNEEIWRQRVEHRKIREKRIKNYTLFCIISSIAAIAAQTISIEQTSAMLLLLAVSLRMGKAYTKFWDDPYRLTYDDFGNRIYGARCYIKICYERYSTDELYFLRYVWLGYLCTRSIIFVIIGILRHIVQADNIFDALLWILHLPEAGYLVNWSFNVCPRCSFHGFLFSEYRYKYQCNIRWLKPGHARDPRNDYLKVWSSSVMRNAANVDMKFAKPKREQNAYAAYSGLFIHR
ncbi:hypothetical protein Ddc_17244 [Ditylenchus destructor]|nr:hypothetical protein Ddc_17244 [Ditylenchus destructor]